MESKFDSPLEFFNRSVVLEIGIIAAFVPMVSSVECSLDPVKI